jgi:hypothetical protein
VFCSTELAAEVKSTALKYRSTAKLAVIANFLANIAVLQVEPEWPECANPPVLFFWFADVVSFSFPLRQL